MSLQVVVLSDMLLRPMVTLRDATEHDSPAIARLHADSWRSAYRGMLSDDYLDHRAHSERAAVRVFFQMSTQPTGRFSTTFMSFPNAPDTESGGDS
jgi:hypothetical protein